MGTVETISDLPAGHVATQPLDSAATHTKLGEFASTAICGNDITSSCLYVAALATLYGGKYGFICLAAVAAMLYLFRNIYAEVGTALPLNGGAYNALLNTTSKFKRIGGGVPHHLVVHGHSLHQRPTRRCTTCTPCGTACRWSPPRSCCLGIFMVLSIIGITESAVVAIGIFVFHIVTLVLLVGSADGRTSAST